VLNLYLSTQNKLNDFIWVVPLSCRLVISAAGGEGYANGNMDSSSAAATPRSTTTVINNNNQKDSVSLALC